MPSSANVNQYLSGSERWSVNDRVNVSGLSKMECAIGLPGAPGEHPLGLPSEPELADGIPMDQMA